MNFYNIDKTILIKSLHNAVIETLEKKYKLNGYNVEREVLIDRYRADLFCQKDNETIVIEVRAIGAKNSVTVDKLLSIKKHIETKFNYKFLIEYFKIPVLHSINIENIEDIIFKHVSENLISEIDSLSTHSYPNEVTNVELTSVNITKEGTFIEGNSDIDFELQWGSKSDLKNNDAESQIENKRIFFKFKIPISNIITNFEYWT